MTFIQKSKFLSKLKNKLAGLACKSIPALIIPANSLAFLAYNPRDNAED